MVISLENVIYQQVDIFQHILPVVFGDEELGEFSAGNLFLGPAEGVFRGFVPEDDASFGVPEGSSNG